MEQNWIVIIINISIQHSVISKWSFRSSGNIHLKNIYYKIWYPPKAGFKFCLNTFSSRKLKMKTGSNTSCDTVALKLNIFPTPWKNSKKSVYFFRLVKVFSVLSAYTFLCVWCRSFRGFRHLLIANISAWKGWTTLSLHCFEFLDFRNVHVHQLPH